MLPGEFSSDSPCNIRSWWTACCKHGMARNSSWETRSGFLDWSRKGSIRRFFRFSTSSSPKIATGPTEEWSPLYYSS